MSEYKTRASKVTLAQALPDLSAERYARVRELDAKRQRLAEEYERADGALLHQIRHLLIGDAGGPWTHYMQARDLPGDTTAWDRMKIAAGGDVPVVRFSRSAVFTATGPTLCDYCRMRRSDCLCAQEAAYRAAYNVKHGITEE